VSQGIAPTLAAGWPRYDDVIGAAAENGYRVGYVTAALASEQERWLLKRVGLGSAIADAPANAEPTTQPRAQSPRSACSHSAPPTRAGQ
jgi:hypothetical protein